MTGPSILFDALSFHLTLYGNSNCIDVEPPLHRFCAPGVGGIVTCPCGNPQVPAGAIKGCNNFAGGGTGGAIMTGTLAIAWAP